MGLIGAGRTEQRICILMKQHAMYVRWGTCGGDKTTQSERIKESDFQRVMLTLQGTVLLWLDHWRCQSYCTIK